MPRSGKKTSDSTERTATFAETMREWLRDRRENISEASADRYEYLMGKYILPEFGDMDVSTITQARMNTYLAGLADKEKKGSAAVTGTTVENLRSITWSILSYAQDREEHIPKLSALVKIEKTPYKPLSSDEIRRLVACARYNRSTELLGVLFSLYAGLGTGEICALSWDDIDTDRREINVRHTLYRLKNKEGGDKRTRLTVTDVRRSAVRTVRYPRELDTYVGEFYKSGMAFLSGERDRYMEQRTYCNRLESVFERYDLRDVTISRVKKTYEAGLADVRYLMDPFYIKEEGSRNQLLDKVDERWLIREMENDLRPLRDILGISSCDMGVVMDIPEDTYMAIEAGEAAMDWDMFMSLLFFFRYNSKTEKVVEALGLYPRALKERMGI